MSAPHLDPNSSLETVRDELVYLNIRICRDPRARDLAPRVGAHLAAWRGVQDAQHEHWDAQAAAQVDVVLADEAIDAHVDGFAADLLDVCGGDRGSPRYTLYFTASPSVVKRPVLGDELETARRWVTLLAAEEDAGLRAHGERFAAEVKDADDALAARAAADSKNASFRAVGAHATYVQGVADTREQVWIELERRRAADKAAGLPRDWATRFFRPRASAESEAERKARAEARDKERQDREAAVERRKLLAASLKKAQADLKEHDKKTARGR